MSRSEDPLSELIGGIYEAALDPGRWEPVCRNLADLFGARGFAIQINNIETGATPLYVSSGIDPAAATEYIAEFSSTDPRVAFSLGLPLGRPHHDYMFITEREMSRHPYYDFLDRWGFRYYGGASIVREGAWVSSASFQRSRQEGAAAAEDIDLLGRLAPHLARAVNIGMRLQTLERHKNAAEHFLELAPFGAALLGGGGEILYMNREARRIASSGEGLVAAPSGLRAVRPDENAALQRLIGSATAVSRGAVKGGGSVSVRKRAGLRALAINVCPLPRDESFFVTKDPAAIAVITDPDAPPNLSHAALHGLFGLSLAEFEIVKALLAGRTVAQIAKDRRVTLRTVRTQIEAIFRKTGTSRQAELVNLLARLPPVS